MKNSVIKLISLYRKNQKFIWELAFAGLITSGCKFYPTCSEYTQEAIKKKGLIRGLIKGSYRVLRCNPISRGGIDLA